MARFIENYLRFANKYGVRKYESYYYFAEKLADKMARRKENIIFIKGKTDLFYSGN